MNRIYKIIWSKTRNCYVVASELVHGNTKATSTGMIARRAALAAVAALLLLPAGSDVFAAGTGTTNTSPMGYNEITVITGDQTDADAISTVKNAQISVSSGTTTVNGVQMKDGDVSVKDITAKDINAKDINAKDITATGDISAKDVTATGDVSAKDITASGTIHADGVITSTGLNTQGGAISGGAITGTSLNTQGGDINGGTITGTSLNAGAGAVTAGSGSFAGNVSTGSLDVTNKINGGSLEVTGDAKIGGTLDVSEFNSDKLQSKVDANNFTTIEGGSVHSKNFDAGPEQLTSESLFDKNGRTEYARDDDSIATTTTSADGITQDIRDVGDDPQKMADRELKQTPDGYMISDEVKDPENSSTINQKADQIYQGVTTTDGSTAIGQSGKNITTMATDGTNTTTTTQDASNITNEAKTGTITNDAKDIANIASEDMTNTIGRNLTTTVGGEMKTTVTGDVMEDYQSDLSTTVGGDMSTEVTGDQSTTVKGDQSNTVEGNQTTTIGGDMSTTVTGDSSLRAKSIINEADTSITDMVGTTTVTTTDGLTTLTNREGTHKTQMDFAEVGKDLSVGGNATVGGSMTASSYKVGDKTYIDSNGINANNQTITNVAPGELSATSTDAVNGAQLFDTNQKMRNFNSRLNRVGAGAAALAALHPLDFDPDSKWDFAAGYGNYRDANAAAVGLYYRPNEDTMFSVGGSFGGGENMVNAGVSLKLGRGSHVSNSRVAMAKEIRDMRKAMAEQAAEIAELKAMHHLAIDPNKSMLFPDVADNHWAYEYVTKLAGNGIIEGYPDGLFKGNQVMTRYEFAAIVYRLMEKGMGHTDPEMNRLAREFSNELSYIRIDTVHQDKDGTPTVQRVRVKK